MSCLLALGFLLAAPANSATNEAAPSHAVSEQFLSTLSEPERAWLQAHPVIRVAQDPGWPPVEFIDERGEFHGISAEYMGLVEQRLGMKFERVRNLSWLEAFDRLRRWEIDMTTSVAATPQRETFWAFTEPYLKIPIVVATQMNVTYIGHLRELAGKKVAVVKNYAIDEWLTRDFPQITLTRVKTTLEGLEKLQRGQVFAYIDNLLIIGYYQTKMKASAIKIAGQTPYVNAQCMAVRKDWAIFAGILQKALESIPEQQRSDIYRRWLPVTFERGFDYTLLWQALIVFAAILLAMVFWNRKLAVEIRSRKQIEEALGESEERLRLSTELANVAVWEYDFTANSMTRSKNHDALYGLEWQTKWDLNTFMNATHPDDREISGAIIQKSVAPGGPDQYTFDFRAVYPDQSVHWLMVAGQVVERNAEGAGMIVRGCLIDITERKRVEILLRESEGKFRNFTEKSFVGFYINQDGRFQYVNPKFSEIFGYSVDECQDNMHFSQIVHPEDLSMVQEMVRRRESGEGGDVQYTFRGIKKTGEVIYLEVYGSTLTISGKIAAIGTVLDITKELEMEKRLAQSQRMEAIGSLAGGIAHDFNNILFPIVGMSELLLEDMAPGSPEHEKASEIFKAGMRGSELVKQILAFSRQTEHRMMPVSFRQVMKEVLKLTRSSIPADIEISQHIEGDVGLVLADPSQLHQIAMNLITNAFHAVEQNGGKISITLTGATVGRGDPANSTLDPGEYAFLSVSDTGCGIDPGIMNKIFEPYFTTKAQGKGTGLGLAVVYGIVKEHRGDIRVCSEPGKGTTFEVFLPLIVKDDAQSASEILEILPTGTERILLVDDEAPIVRLEGQMLERLGYRVTAHTGSYDALKAFRANPSAFDLVVSDMTMPNMTGDQLAKELIAIRPDIPIIVCTGFSERINKEKAALIGITGFLMKPIVKTELAKMVRAALDAHRADT